METNQWIYGCYDQVDPGMGSYYPALCVVLPEKEIQSLHRDQHSGSFITA